MARDGDQRFSRAASRWVERFGAETGAGLPEVQLAAAALGWLWENPESGCRWRRLRLFCRDRFPEGMRGIPPLQRLPISCFLMLVTLRGMSEENVERRAAMQRGTEAFNRETSRG